MSLDASPNPLSTPASRYRLLDRLGAGGMGAVYRAHDRLTGVEVALKRVLLPGFEGETPTSDSDDLRLRLAWEFRMLASLRHPNIITVLDYGFDVDGTPFFTMELLEDALPITRAGRDLPLPQQVRLLTDTLRALAYLHRRGILHRDVKPGNILVDGRGAAKVLDFGLALDVIGSSSANLDQLTVGTLNYMPPELFAGASASVASDLYGVGLVAYEMFVGKFPYKSHTMAALLGDIMRGEPDVSMLEGALAQVIVRLMAKDPEDRYPDAQTALVALCQATGQPVPIETVQIRESFLRTASTVGRKEEIAHLNTALNETFDGRGSGWLIGGESGVGKSRLLEEIRIRALIRGALVLRGQAINGGGAPFMLWRESVRHLLLATPVSDLEAAILKEVVPDVEHIIGRAVASPPPLPGVAGRQRLLLTLTELFARQTRPLVLILEDLHWAGDDLHALSALLPHVGERPWLILGAYREEESPNLPESFPLMKPMKLGRLSESAIEELSAAMLGQVGRDSQLVGLLKRETEGNAFFMVEVVRVLAEQAGSLEAIGHMTLPENIMAGGVREVVRLRLASVPTWAYPLLEVAAVAGRRVDALLLSHVAADYLTTYSLDTWLTACVNAAVFEASEGGWHFAHDKLREVILADLAADKAPRLHRAVALAIESLYPGRRAEALLEHWMAAGDADRALAYTLIVLPTLATVNSNYAETERLAQRAFTLTNQLSEPLAVMTYRAHLWRYLGYVAEKRGEFGRAAHHYRVSHRLSPHPDLQLQALNAASRLEMLRGEYTTALELGQQALALGREIGGQADIATSLNNLGNISYVTHAYEDAHAYYHESLELRQSLNDPSAMGASLSNLGNLAYTMGQYAEASRYLEASLELLRASGNRWGIGASLSNLSFARLGGENITGARASIREGLEVALQIEADTLIVEILIAAARLALQGGDALHAARLAGLIDCHPALEVPVRTHRLTPLLTDIAAALDPTDLESALAAGRGLGLRAAALDEIRRLG